MAFVREKHGYHYLVQNRRDGKRVRQTVLAYLGKSETVQDRLDLLRSQQGDKADAEALRLTHLLAKHGELRGTP